MLKNTNDKKSYERNGTYYDFYNSELVYRRYIRYTYIFINVVDIPVVKEGKHKKVISIYERQYRIIRFL